MSEAILRGYAADADELAVRYEALDSAELYAPLAHLVPDGPFSAVDIGAGAGRDAAWLAGKGYRVLAVEPVEAFRAAGSALHRGLPVTWLDDTLPALSATLARGETFDIVNGVWQHLDDAERRVAMRSLRALVAPAGRAILALRHGPGAPARPCFPIRVDDTIELARTHGLAVVYEEARPSIQPQNRAAGVTWTWLVLAPASDAAWS